MQNDNLHNLHISITDFKNETRIIKEISSLKASGLFKTFTVIALHSDGLKLSESIENGAEVIRIKLVTRKLPTNLFFQIFKYIEYLYRVLLMASKNPPRAVNVHSLSLLPIGFMTKLLFKSKLIYDTHELETEVFGLQGFRQTLAKVLEKFFIKYCDLTVVVGPKINEWYKSTYGIEAIVSVLNCPFFRDRQVVGSLRSELNINKSKKIAIYIGNLNAGRGLEEILLAFSNTDRSDLVVVFMGYGDMQDKIRSYAIKHENIYYKKAVNHDQVVNYACDADLGFCLIEKTCLNDFYALPNKLFEYSMSYTPIICSPMVEIADLMKNFQIGEVIESNFNETIWQAVNKILNYEDIDVKFKKFNEEFCWERQEKRLITAYKAYNI